jgi:hypothetical protein
MSKPLLPATIANLNKIPNPWIIDSEADFSHALEAAGVFQSSLPSEESDPVVTLDCAPAVPIEPDATDCIAEILAGYGRQVLAPAKEEFPPGFCPHTFMDTLEAIVEAIDPVPEFLRRTA